jgi:hypothetical protein
MGSRYYLTDSAAFKAHMDHAGTGTSCHPWRGPSDGLAQTKQLQRQTETISHRHVAHGAGYKERSRAVYFREPIPTTCSVEQGYIIIDVDYQSLGCSTWRTAIYMNGPSGTGRFHKSVAPEAQRHKDDSYQNVGVAAAWRLHELDG